MNRKIKNIIISILIAIIGIHINPVTAQNLKNLESRLMNLIRRNDDQNKKLASQQNTLNAQITVINALKTDKEMNEQHLRTELSKSKTISTNIGNTKSEIGDINYQIIQIKQLLRKRYAQLIDSLQIAGKDLSDPQLSACFFRRLELTPEIKSFSFNPRMVNEANVNSEDSLEQIISRNYLELTIAEIDSNLKMILEIESQLTEQLRFARKTERFLDDIGDSPNFSLRSIETTTESSRDGLDIGLGGYYENPKLITNSRSYKMIIEQISPYLSSTTESRLLINAEINNIDQYLNLEQKTIQYLKLYRDHIADKLNQ